MTYTGAALEQRQAGLLLHITSLPESPGNGDLSHGAYRFVEFLAEAGFGVWQVLPLGPTHEDGSPYQALSAHAGNPMLISLEWLADKGLLSQNDIAAAHAQGGANRQALLQKAYSEFQAAPDTKLQKDFEQYREAQAHWLVDFSRFTAIKAHQHDKPWWQWDKRLRDRDSEAVARFVSDHAQQIAAIEFTQYLFDTQWSELKTYAQAHGVKIFGDMPIFVAHDSAEVWAHRELFSIRKDGHAEKVAGVPPDYFSKTGQRWGNPHYNWERMQADGFNWWLARLETELRRFDLIRIDHFRGLEAYWEIDAKARTAKHGHWVKAPGEALLRRVQEHFGGLPIVAEDLGTITPEVIALRDAFSLPGMKILQFAFDGNRDNPYLSHNHVDNSVVYTGTHDNDTSLGWYQHAQQAQREHMQQYLGYPNLEMPWPLIYSALRSVARLAIVPVQDILALDSGARMNRPGEQQGNWQWRLKGGELDARLAEQCRALNELFDRAP